ncbi:YihY/virulence factor BrkB family protein [Dokdonella sp.]|uniref:YihY/virulence factor BrkB family protein n=1 Tax=Dokdonella sp. TaxID=2291710 RepID=UPI001B0C64A7|nr:YihY/virulence factor BrkB family protein [Dokdonella sp.]MBO9662861.1 YihY/virulence factor BrkB family protein [Dokdonella sp.]
MRAVRPLRVAHAAVTGFVAHDDLTLAASIAYYTALSLAPLLVLALWLAASVTPNAQAEIAVQVGALAGEQARAAVATILDNASRRPSFGSAAGIAGAVLLVISASAVFSQLQTALNVVWSDAGRERVLRAGALRAWLRRRLLSFGLLAAFVFLLIVSLTVSTVLAVLLPRTGAAWDVVNQLVAVVVFAALFAGLFAYLPDRRPPWHAIHLGAVATALLFAAGKYAIGEYLAHSGIAGAYGPAGSLALLLVWVYYSAAIFLFGAELVRALAPGGE